MLMLLVGECGIDGREEQTVGNCGRDEEVLIDAKRVLMLMVSVSASYRQLPSFHHQITSYHESITSVRVQENQQRHAVKGQTLLDVAHPLPVPPHPSQ